MQYSTTRLTIAIFLFVTLAIATYSDDYDTKHMTTRDGTNYSYDYVPAKGRKPTVLFLHGYPGTRHNWHGQMIDLSAAGYGVISPDCLGYGDSDILVDIGSYNFKHLTEHITEILDKEGVHTVVGVGHDWGSGILSRLAVWHPTRLEKLVFLSVGYSAPGLFFDLDAINSMGLQQYGYMQFGFWYFFNSYDAAQLVAANLESFFHLVFPTDISAWAKNLAQLGAARAWLSSNTTTSLPRYVDEDFKRIWLASFSREGAVQASMNYYKSAMRGLQEADEEALTGSNRTLHVPVLAIGGAKDLVGRADQIRKQTEPWAAKGYTERTLETGHWIMHEDRQGLSSILLEFLIQSG
ncbi:hypothetical protein FSARC_9995 [Fusarium sarcochroum]|uniref:AB hydrolase-1 domain-containing protein n=1 Tax=Fusarium sarcochroum TaxID=1208366 RepID=A0A8H4TQ79_9HYPO|nr:hypothetical protein FSARC_9995 [Fusarium sarcochroum]